MVRTRNAPPYMLQTSLWLMRGLAHSCSLDNSEWTRNGDYAPTRAEAQSDAVNLLCNAKVPFGHAHRLS